jgi:trk system potassium uptake protein TrkA
MRIVIAGCGRVGSDLALRLAAEGHDVSVIDSREGVFRRLGKAFDGLTHVGRAYEVSVLEQAGIETADAFVAVTDSDNANLMSVQIAKKVFGVERTVARLDDPARAGAYQALGVHYVAGAKLTSDVIREEILAEAFRYHVTFSSGDVEIAEMVMGPAVEGRVVGDLEIRNDLRVAAVQRDGVTHIVDERFSLRPGDLVVAAARLGAHGKVKKYLRVIDGI